MLEGRFLYRLHKVLAPGRTRKASSVKPHSRVTHEVLRAGCCCCSFFDQPGVKTRHSFTLPFITTNLQAKILGNTACKCQQFESGRMLKSHPPVPHLYTRFNTAPVSSTSAAYIANRGTLPFPSTERGKPGPRGRAGVSPRAVGGTRWSSPEGRVWPWTLVHAHARPSLAKAESWSNGSAVVSLLGQCTIILVQNSTRFYLCVKQQHLPQTKGFCKADIKHSSAAHTHTCFSSQTLWK